MALGKRCDFTKGNLVFQVIKFAIPILLTTFLNLTFNTVDTFMIGRWGGDTPEECEIALAAVGSCASLIALLVNFFMGLSVGAGVSVSYSVGAKDIDNVKKIVRTAVTFAASGGVVVAVMGIIAVRPALTLMGTDPIVLDEAALYMTAYMCGIPANIIYNYCASMLRATGDTVRPLIFLTSGGVINVCLNAVMIFVFRLGALGVGIATAASFWVSCTMIIVYMTRGKGICAFSFKNLGIDWIILKKILKIGIPAGIEDSLFSFSNVLIQSSINSFGAVAMAGNTAAKSIDSYMSVFTSTFCQSAITAVSQNHGAKNYKRLKKSIFVCAAMAVVTMVTVGLVLCIFGESLISLFVKDNPEVVEWGLIRLRIMAATYFTGGLMSMGSYVLRGLGKSVTSTSISLGGTCILRVIWTYTMFVWFRSFAMVFYVYPVTWVVTGAITYVMIYLTLKKIIRAHKAEQAALEEKAEALSEAGA